MESLTESLVRASFVNATKGEVARLTIPRNLMDEPWSEIGVLGWIDPKSPLHGSLVVATAGGGVVGVQLRCVAGTARRARMCSLCTTTHPGQGVALMVAPRAGRPGRDGNTVGQEMCASLACTAYARGTLRPPGLHLVQETLSVEERLTRLHRNALAFVERVLR